MSAKKQPLQRHPLAQARAERQKTQRQAALELLSALDCLRGVPTNELVLLLDGAIFRAFIPGVTVFGRHKRDRFFFLVLDGALDLKQRDKDGREVLMGVLGRGDCFGEGPLFGDFFRRMSARAQAHCYLLQIPLDHLRAILPATPRLATALRQVYKRRMVECTLARVPLLGQLLPMERLALANLMQPIHVARGELIMHQGEPADALYLIESGQALVEQSGQTVATLGEGDFFGEMALLTRQPHRASVRALTPGEVLVLPGVEFHRLIEQRPDLEAQLHTVIERRMRNSAAVQNDETRAHHLELAVTRGLLRATHLLVRTPELCPPGCRICEEACTERHGRARLQLNGTTIDAHDVLDSCWQCSAGAECMESCPEDAFERTENGTLIITDRCTGCGECVTACPYDAVVNVPVAPPIAPGGPLGALLRKAVARVRPHAHTIPLEPAAPTLRADKCDRCYGHDDLACISRCPTGSLQLIPVEDLFPL
jgi:CRP-like cAMP-binding protein/Fe-S-cluster-containing hydrogenase component 2